LPQRPSAAGLNMPVGTVFGPLANCPAAGNACRQAIQRTGMPKHNLIETCIEQLLFRSRWILAPFYIGLVAALIMLLGAFFAELIHALPSALQWNEVNSQQIILATLEMIDLSLAGNLVVIVIFSGYENFVSKITTKDTDDRPDWMGTLDFSGLKMKLIASVVAISVIQMLRVFMTLADGQQALDVPRMRLMLILHLTFVVSGVLFAVMDWIRCHAEKPHGS
jgi:uncharacterized protein (TIGR00645 family)